MMFIQEDNKKLRIRNDLIMIGVILIIALIVFVATKFFEKTGNVVIVKVENETYGTYPLDEDAEIMIYHDEDKTRYNKVVIKDGFVSVESASCPDKICVNHRKINKEGETIVCLPNKLYITISNTEDM